MPSKAAESVVSDLNGQGFAIAAGALNSRFCEDLGNIIIAEYQRLTSAGWKFAGGGRYTGHLNIDPGHYGPQVLQMLRENGLVAKAEEALGSRLELFRYSGNFNLPDSHRQDIHQDWAPPGECAVFNVMLVPTSTANGATELVPGTHLDHYSYRSLHNSGILNCAIRPQFQPGDVVIRRGTLWHRGTTNQSTTPRPMLCLIMVPAENPRADPPGSTEISFTANRFYGPYARARELAEIHLSRLIHLARMLRG